MSICKSIHHIVTLYLLVLQRHLLRNLQAPCEDCKLNLPVFLLLGTDPISSNYLEYPLTLSLHVIQMQPYTTVSPVTTFCTSQDSPACLLFQNFK